MGTGLLALVIAQAALLLGSMLGDYARFVQHTDIVRKRAEWVAADLAENCVVAGNDCTGDDRVCVTADGKMRVTVSQEWEPQLWVGLSPVQAAYERSFATATVIDLGTVFTQCV
ncbi:MAG: hypothetical protein OXN80_05760 [bacterium]|nr:hypothetical protein [bacterium]